MERNWIDWLIDVKKVKELTSTRRGRVRNGRLRCRLRCRLRRRLTSPRRSCSRRVRITASRSSRVAHCCWDDRTNGDGSCCMSWRKSTKKKKWKSIIVVPSEIRSSRFAWLRLFQRSWNHNLKSQQLTATARPKMVWDFEIAFTTQFTRRFATKSHSRTNPILGPF